MIESEIESYSKISLKYKARLIARINFKLVIHLFKP